MIANQAELERTRGYLTVLEAAVQELRERVHARNPERFLIMASSYLAEIKRVRANIDEYMGISLALESSSDFFIKFEGPSHEGMAPVPIVSRSIDALQRCLKKFGEYIARAELNVGVGVSRSQLARHFELDVATVNSGSLRVGLKIAEIAEPIIPSESAKESSRRFGEALRVILRGDGLNEFRRLLPDVSFQLPVLKSMRDLAPPKPKRDYRVWLAGRYIGEMPVVLGEEQRAYISSVIRATMQEAVQEGIVREINLEKHTFQIRSQAALLRCHYQAELEERVMNALNRRVRVIGRARINIDGSVKLIQVRDVQTI